MYDLIIIGAGPAGLTSALYALRSNKKVLILEAKIIGGQIINANKIENYPGIPVITGVEYAMTLYNQVKNFGAEIKYEAVIRVDEEKNVITTKNKYKAKAIIIATGAEKRKLGIENEAKFIGKGISYCATCDGNFYKQKKVAIIGGGNTALEDAIYLSNLVEKAYLIHRKDDFKGEAKLYEEIKNKSNVEIIFNANIKKINGENKLESIEIIQNGKTINKYVEGLFICIGQEPKNEIFKNIIEINEKGYIKSSDGVHTNVQGIYVAGDAREKDLRQLATAIGDGANAATTAIKEMMQ